MLTYVIYDSQFGNTEKIAQAIARGAGALGNVRVMRAAEVTQPFTERPDLVLLGGPTQRHGMSPGLRGFVDAMVPSFAGVRAASFDTRYRQASWLTGSAATDVAKRLRKAGGYLVAPPESFFMSRTGATEVQGLEAGELERAEAWGRTVGAAAGAPA